MNIMLLKTSIIIYLLTLCASSHSKESNDCNLSEALKEEIRRYQPVVDKIISSVTTGQFRNLTYSHLVRFIDKFGNRISGSDNLEKAIDYVLDISQKHGLENVHAENACVPHWIRGNESAAMLHPRYQDLSMLGLGRSVGTPPEGITAPVVVVSSFDELRNISDMARGKIVVFNPPWEGYGETVNYRLKGSSEASRYGAVGALIRSITPFSLDTPHTGDTEYDSDMKKIPVAAITPADANMIQRMYQRGEEVVIRMKMEAKNLGYKTSRNTIAEIKGSEVPEKVVVVSGHLDSWDVGQGAMDDGAGSFLSWSSTLLLHNLQLRPRRTIRTILWTGEEQGYFGAQEYVKQHMNGIENFNLVMESDWGTFTPVGLTFSGTNESFCIVQEVMSLLRSINATGLKRESEPGSDITYWTDMGVPGAGLWNRNEQYFWHHHSKADTMDVEDPVTLDLCTAVWATVSYVIADLSVDLPKNLTLPQR